jgi:hypothetical protein
MKFPNKMITSAYNAAIGRTFTWSPTKCKFVDEFENSSYDYHAMIWLKDNGWLIETFDKTSFVYKYGVKK